MCLSHKISLVAGTCAMVEICGHFLNMVCLMDNDNIKHFLPNNAHIFYPISRTFSYLYAHHWHSMFHGKNTSDVCIPSVNCLRFYCIVFFEQYNNNVVRLQTCFYGEALTNDRAKVALLCSCSASQSRRTFLRVYLYDYDCCNSYYKIAFSKYHNSRMNQRSIGAIQSSHINLEIKQHIYLF